jgi:hypothetical protein
VVAERGTVFEHHVEVRVEAAGRHHHRFAADRHRLTGAEIAALQASDAATLEPQSRDLRLGNDLAAFVAEAFDEVSHQAQAVAIRPGPAQHRVALLDLQIDPFHAERLGPVIEVVERMLDVIAGPDLVGRRTAPCDPVLERQVGRVLDAVLLLQWRSDDQAAAAGDNGRAAKLGALLECDGARPRVAGLDAGRHAGAAGANDRHIGFVLPDIGHLRNVPDCHLFRMPGARAGRCPPMRRFRGSRHRGG